MLDREGCILCNLLPGIGYVKYSALVAEFGAPSRIFGRTPEEYRRVTGIGQQLAERLSECDFERELESELLLAEKAGVRILTLFDEGYPAVLRNLYDPPLCLYVRGRLPSFPESAVAVVGTRRMSDYGCRMTRAICEEAVASNFTIVSGLAYGVDTVAHWTAVECGGITVAVLGGGLMHIHPQENVPLARRIVETGGAVISEFPLRAPVSQTTFPRRNRIVAGLARATIVTEAGTGSGALITARLALDNGRDVFAVPGHADNAQAKGCHQLIREGAAGLVENFSDVMNGMGLGFLPGLHPGGEVRDAGIAYDPDSPSDLSPEARKVWMLLDGRELSFDRLAEESGFDSGTLLAILMRLEMKLLVEHGADQVYRRMNLRS